MKSHIKSANLSAVISREIQKQMSDAVRNEERDIQSLVLYVLMEEFGFGKTRLERFAKKYHECLDNLAKWYEMNSEDELFLVRRKLTEAGINVEELYKEEINDER